MTLSVACGHSYILPSYHCYQDFLYFHDFGSFRRRYCGSITINFTTDYNWLIALFKSSYYRTAKGFICYIWVTATTSTTTSTTESSTTSTTTSTTESTSSSSTLPTASPKCSCGKVNRGTRIVGGHETEINEYPWQVGIVKNSSKVLSPFCGGSIIDKYHILTAAHCVDSRNPGDINVVVGDHHTGKTDETDVTKRISVESITIHKDYDSSTLDNDIAIIKLAEPIEFQSDNKIAPVCLPDAKTNYSNVEAIVSGWGALSSGGSSPDSLHEVAVTTLTNDECSESYSSLTDNMICAGDPNGGKDSCQGDSGGPLVTSNGGSMQLIGIVSWGRGCALKDYPGVYTSVQKYLSWINDVTGGICTP
ncbi:trypsin-1-like [Oratosquilla oratoria]|uniref:trypsin-1-like n=1 Tax=Oratosquilla oratoria TaxID=337810 RepID=UPI003F765FBA